MVGSVAGDGGRSAAGEVVTRDTCASGDDGSWRWPDTMVEGSPFQSSIVGISVPAEPLCREPKLFEVCDFYGKKNPRWGAGAREERARGSIVSYSSHDHV